MIIGKDNFIWKKVAQDDAEMILHEGIFDLYEVNVENEYESLITEIEELNNVFDFSDNEVCIEVGFIEVKPKIIHKLTD